jgi:hypothetical protein
MWVSSTFQSAVHFNCLSTFPDEANALQGRHLTGATLFQKGKIQIKISVIIECIMDTPQVAFILFVIQP